VHTASLAALGALCAVPGVAAATQAQAGASAVEGPSFLPMVLALVVVLGVLGAAIWALRRAGLVARGGASSQLRLITQLALGPRERVVIVEAGERWWLLGIGANGVTRLGTLPKGEAVAPQMPASFGALLDKLRAGGH